MHLEEAVKDADPVVVTTSSNVVEEEGSLMDSSSLPPSLQPSLSYTLPEENHLKG